MAASAPTRSKVARPPRKSAQPNNGAEAKALEAARQRIADFLVAESKKNTIVLKDAFDRNIMFVGKSRSGKTTAKNILQDPYQTVSVGSLFSETVDAKITHFTVEVPTESGERNNYNIGIIDTPGLFEIKCIGEEARDLEKLEDVIMKCLSLEITKIHAIFFVQAYTGAFNVEDLLALERFVNLFAGAGEHIHILITHAEQLDEDRQQEVIQELLQVEKLAKLLGQVAGKFHFCGAVKEALQRDGLVREFKKTLDNVIDMRNELCLGIFDADEPFELNSIERASSIREKALVLLHRLEADLETNPLPVPFKAACEDLKSKKAVLRADERASCELFLQRAGAYLEAHRARALLEQLPKDWLANKSKTDPLRFQYDCSELKRFATNLNEDEILRVEQFLEEVDDALEEIRKKK